MASEYTGKPCPKCGHVRTEGETAPDWQCPKCGIAYAKFAEAPAQPSYAGQGVGSGLDLTKQPELFVTQKFEWMQLLNFETRNRYQISDAAGRPLAYAAEQQGGWIGALLRQVFGHWRTFEIHFYDNNRQPFLHAHHPFRIYFSRLEVFNGRQQRIGAIQKQFAFLTKKFTLEDAHGRTIMEVASPLWKLWTFPFKANGIEVASVQKKWSGLLSEAFTDRDNFRVEFGSRALGNDERLLVLAAAIYVDLTYFEKKGD